MTFAEVGFALLGVILCLLLITFAVAIVMTKDDLETPDRLYDQEDHRDDAH